MTTILGVQYPDGIVAVSDTQVSRINTSNGDLVGKGVTDKVHVNQGAGFAVGLSGIASEDRDLFCKRLDHRSGDKPWYLNDCLEQLNFPDVALLQVSRTIFEEGEPADILFALGYRDPVLFSIYGFRKLSKMPYACIGSGAEFSYEMLRDGYREGMSFEEARTLALKAFDNALANDPYSSGMQMYHVGKGRVLRIGREGPLEEKLG